MSDDDTPPGGFLPIKRGRRPSGEYAGILCDAHTESIGDHERRIRSLEKAHWRLLGISAGVCGFAALAGSILGRYLP